MSEEAAVSASVSGATASYMTAIRVMSFNVLLTELPQEEEITEDDLEWLSKRAWSKRADLNVSLIKRYEPTVIGFQELDRGHLATYQEHLTGYSHCLADAHVQSTGNAIFWLSERFRREDAGIFWLSRTPDEPSNDWGVPYPLTVSWLLLKDLESVARILFANTQFEDGPWGEVSRQESSKLMVRRLPQLAGDAPILVTGDFNTRPWTPAYLTFLEHGFVDTYRAAGNGDSISSSTFHDFRGADYFALEYGNEVFWRVDWILSRDGAQRVQTLSSSIIRDAAPPLYPSDHYPVVTEFVLL